jgi:hypothetical protein
MNRVNFDHCSNVIVNVCSRDGTWFDKDQLQRIVEFIRAGGLEQERARQIADLEEHESHARAAALAGAGSVENLPAGWSDCGRHDAISAVASVIGRLLG